MASRNCNRQWQSTMPIQPPSPSPLRGPFGPISPKYPFDSKTGRFRTWGYFRDQFLSMGTRYSLQTSLSFGCLDIIGSSAGTHGLGEAPGDVPTRENDNTGLSLNLTLLESFYLQTVFAPGRDSKLVSDPEVWVVWRALYMRTRKYSREGPSTRPDPRF